MLIEEFMASLRLYLSVLTITLLCLFAADRRFGWLEAIVITCSLMFLIFDMRADLEELKALEAKVSSISRTNVFPDPS